MRSTTKRVRGERSSRYKLFPVRTGCACEISYSTEFEALAESIGVNGSGFRVFAFSLGCFYAGIAGAFYSHYFSAIAPGSFGFLLSINVFIYMVVGGMRKFYGPAVGSVVLTLIPELARELKEYEPFVFAGILLLVIFFLREGLAGLPALLGKRGTSATTRSRRRQTERNRGL